jgi:zinc D-Ala-D-Ala carboxypeptidase
MCYGSAPFRVFLSLLCALVISGFTSSGRGSHAQNSPRRTPASESGQSSANGGVVRLSAPAKPARGAGFAGVSLAAPEAAASSNAQLQTSLEWGFGGRQQRGWSLYLPLIGELIGVRSGAAATEFAVRLSLWQQQNGIEPTGVLDSETWSQMVLRFQSRRIGGRNNFAPNHLVTIPLADCYDPTRAEELRSVDRETYAAYKRMVSSAAADSSLGLLAGRDGQLTPDERLLKIISAYRSRAYQDQLRRQSPKSGRAALAINSPHTTGRALDLYVGGEPVSTKDENRAIQTRSAVYLWLVKNAPRFGFQPYFYEPWHWEYVGAGNNDAK